MYQITSLVLTFRTTKGGARGKALCHELLEFTPEVLKKLQAFNLDNFLQRNEEKRMSVLTEFALKIWDVIKDTVHACPVPDVLAAEEALDAGTHSETSEVSGA